MIDVAGKHLYILADDRSGRMRHPTAGPPPRSACTYEHWSADAIVAEKNYGGDMGEEQR